MIVCLVRERMNSGLTSNQQRGHTDTGDLGLKSHLKTSEAGDRSRDPWIGSLVCYPLHHRRSSCQRKGPIEYEHSIDLKQCETL